MMSNVQRFTELSRANINDNRDIVISLTQSGTVVMAQQLNVAEGKTIHGIFLKGAFEIPTIDALYRLRDAVDKAIEMQNDFMWGKSTENMEPRKHVIEINK